MDKTTTEDVYVSQRARLRAIYEKCYQSFSIESIIDKFEEYCIWCANHKVIPKDILTWATCNQAYPDFIMNKLREFLYDFDM